MSPVRPARRAIAAFVMLVVFVWVPVVLAARAEDAGAPFASPSYVYPHFSARPGVNLTASELASPSLERTLAMLEAGGVRWARFTVGWDKVEPEPGRYDWSAVDAALAALARHPAIEPVLVLDRTPEWARPRAGSANPLTPPQEYEDFGAFARAIAERYGDRITYYQVWHEPNIAPHWGAAPIDPAGYTRLLREAAVNLRAADPEAQVVLAALAPTVETGGANLSDVSFLDGVYAAGGAEWFDIAAAQPYGFTTAPGDAPAADKLNFARVTLLRQVMDRHGDVAAPIWATAWGWRAGEADADWPGVSATEQAQYVREAFAIAARDWSWLGPLFWPAACPKPGDPWGDFSLCEDGELSPAGEALSAAAADSGILGPGRHPMDHPALQAGAGWRSAAGLADPPKGQAAAPAPGAGPAPANPMEFLVDGSGIALELQGGAYWGYLGVTVDGGPANALPVDERGISYVVLHDPSAAVRTVPVATGLAESEHKVVLTPAGGWGQWPLRAVIVAAASPGLPVPLPLLAVAAAGLTFVAALVLFSERGARALRSGGQAAGRSVSRLTSLLDTLTGRRPGVLWTLVAILGVALYFSPSTPITLAVLAALGVLFLASPGLSLPLIAASLPFWQQPKSVLRWEFGLFELLAWTGAVALAARLLLDRTAGETSERPPFPSLDLAMLALFASALISAVFAAEQGVAWREWRIVFLFGIVVYWIVRRASAFRQAPPGLRTAIIAGLLAGSVIVSLAGLCQLVTGDGRVEVEGVLRIRALYGSPNNLALVLDRAAPLALALALFGAGRVRWLYAAAALVILAACVATLSKGALLLGLPAGIAAVLIGGAVRTGRRWPLWLLAAGAVAGMAGLLLLFQTQRFADLFNFQAGTSFFRIRLWQGALNMALDHPLLGIGPDNFLYAYRTRYVLPSAWQELNLSHPHNILLDMWTRLGLLGVAAGLWALVAGARAAWRRWRSAGPLDWPVALGLLAILLVTLTHGLIDNSLFLPDLMGWFALALGLLATPCYWQGLDITDEAVRQE